MASGNLLSPMLAMAVLLGAVAAPAQPRTIVLTEEVRSRPVTIDCTAGRATRIVFPEPSSRMKISAGAKETLGVRFVATRPHAVVEVKPAAAGATGTLEFMSASGVLTLRLRAVDSIAAAEVRLTLPPPAETPAPARAPAEARRRTSAAPASTPTAVPVTVPPSLAPVVPAPSHLASPSPAPPSTTAEAPSEIAKAEAPALPSPSVPPLDVSELLQLRPVTIGRREGLPGQKPVVLEDALKSTENVWLRFRVVGGAKERVASVSWEHGPVTSFLVASEGKDLRVVVRLPRAQVTKKSRVRIRLEGEKADRAFALGSPWLSSFIRSLVE